MDSSVRRVSSMKCSGRKRRKHKQQPSIADSITTTNQKKFQCFNSGNAENGVVISTANRFRVLEDTVGGNPKHTTTEHQQRKQEQTAISSYAINKCETLKLTPFFTVEQLSNQFRVFNLTKYARSAITRFSPSTKKIYPTASSTIIEPISAPISSPTYIPPHRRLPSAFHQDRSQNSPTAPSTSLQDRALNIASEAIDETWSDCIKKGVFAIWNGSSKDIHPLIDWLNDNCQGQVSIFHHLENILFLKCEEESIKKEFVSVSECFFKGHCVKFIDWFHNFNIEQIDCMTPLWFSINALPPELCDIDIIYTLGSFLGEVIAVDASFFYCNSIKILINVNIKHPTEILKKVETGKASYDIRFQIYRGKIIDILRSDEFHQISPKILPQTSEFKSIFPKLSSGTTSRGHRPDKENDNIKSQSYQIPQSDPRNSLTNTIAKKEHNSLSALHSNIKIKQKIGKVENSPKNKGTQKKKRIYNSRDDMHRKKEDINKMDQQSIKSIIVKSNKEATPNQKMNTTASGKKGKCPASSPIERVKANNRNNEVAKDDEALPNTITDPSRKYSNLGTQEKSSGRTMKGIASERLKIIKAAEGGQNKNYEIASHRNKDMADSGNHINTEQIENHDILEMENDLLFTTPDKGKKNNSFHSEELVQLEPQSLREEDSEQQKHYSGGSKGSRGSTKFWQTPNDHISSPFTPVKDQLSMWRSVRNKEESKILEVNINRDEQDRIFNSIGQTISAEGKSEGISDNLPDQIKQGKSQTEASPILELQKFLNTEGSPGYPDKEMCMTKEEETKINQLTEDLVQAFCPDNLDKTSEAQKKELVLRILELGGENYTSENLRRDLLNIQMEDTKAALVRQTGILNQIMEEDNIGTQELQQRHKIDIVQTAENNIDQLGICMSQEGPKRPCCGKIKGKRGRKSLKEIREAESHNKDQQKIDHLFHNGKGKHLPTQV